MAQSPGFGLAKETSTSSGNVFGSVAASTQHVVFGATGFGSPSQSRSSAENLAGQPSSASSSDFGTFGDARGHNAASLFGGASKSGGFRTSQFGDQSKQPSQKSPIVTSVFGGQPLFGNSADKTSSSVPFIGAGVTAVNTFQGEGNVNKPSQAGLFGKRDISAVGTVFGGSSLKNPVASGLFGKPGTITGSGVFGGGTAGNSDQGALFGNKGSSIGNNTLNSGGFKSASSNSGSSAVQVFGAKSSPSVFGGIISPQQQTNPFGSTTSSFTPSASSSIFTPKESLFTGFRGGVGPIGKEEQGSSNIANASDAKFVKGSGTVANSTLFGKKQADTAVMPSTVPAVKELSQTGLQRHSEKPLFGKMVSYKEATTSNSVVGGKKSSLIGGTPMGSAPSQPPRLFGKSSNASASSQSVNLFGKSSNTSAAQDRSSVQCDSALSPKTGPSLFGKSDVSSGDQAISDKNLFTQTTTTQLFGKTEPTQKSSAKPSVVKEQALFGKAQAATNLFGKEQATSSSIDHGEAYSGSDPSTSRAEQDYSIPASSPPKRSLSKWNRARDPSSNVEKKRAGEDVESRDTKRARSGYDQGEMSTSPSSGFSRSRLTSLRQQSVEDQSLKTSIIVKDIPVNLNKGQKLRDHFSRFGSIKRLQPLPTKNACNITFHNHADAKAAKDKGKHIRKGLPPVTIYWRNIVKSPGLAPNSAANKSPENRQTSIQRGVSSVSTFPTNNAVQAELASMAGTFDHEEEIGPRLSGQREHQKQEQPQASVVGSTSHRQSTQRRVDKSPTPPRRAALKQAGRGSADRRSPTPPRRYEEEEPAASPLPDTEIAKKLLKIMLEGRPKDATETFAILDARDKFLRLVRKRHSNLAAAKAFKGTCNDMCTEKERYYREDIRRLALYEVIPSTLTSVTNQKSKVDHSRAVKEYSRSSADQEEPLPHELRPLHVLMTTMNYLLSEVADEGGEGKWSEWYDFLWNRSRGIRKDITQQQLCEVEVAELLEKCVRFHVFCSARLCEEDMMSFDAKINNENLTKCLQTLKELYADLEKRMIFCPNEAEFRAFMVLMNLNEGDTLREVQQLRPEIRESVHVNFALKAYHALSSHNYVRFFRLVKQATFLNACVLHRYFNQMRGQALRIIMKAHRATGKNKIMYPVQEMIRLLCFEDSSQVEEFCDHYCLTVEASDIVMDAQAFLEPEGSIKETRAPTLVEAKRTVSVGEIINGCPLPQLQLPIPTSSFDETGTFILPLEVKDALKRLFPTMENQSQMGDSGEDAQELSAPAVRESLPSAIDVQRERAQYSSELCQSSFLIKVVKSVVRMLILEELDTEMANIATQFMNEETHLFLIRAEVEDISSSTIQQLIRNVAEETVEEEERKLRQRLAQEMAAQRQRVFTALCDNVVEETVSQMSISLANQEMEHVNAKLHSQRLERCSLEVRDDLLTGSLDSLVLDLAQEVFEVDVLAKRERLAATEACVVVMRCRRFFQTWRRNYLSQIRVKRAMLDFPSTAPSRHPGEQMQRLVPHRPDERLVDKAFYINNRTKLTVQSPMEVIQQQLFLSTQLSMASARRMLTTLVQWRPLDLSEMVAPQLYKAFNSWLQDALIEPDIIALQWKLVVSLPKQETLGTELESNFIKWMRSKLCRGSNRETLLKATPNFEGEVLSHYHLNNDGIVSGSMPLGVCIRAFHGSWNDNQEIAVKKKDLLKGTSAVLFMCPCSEDLSAVNSSEVTTLWEKSKQRLHQMLKQKPITPGIPLVLVVPRLSGEGTVALSELQERLELPQLHKCGLLSAVHVAQIYIGAQDHPVEFFSAWTTQLSTCLRFAASHMPVPPNLRVKPVSNYVEDLVVEFYKAPVYHDLRTRTRLQLLHQSPNSLVSLYNEVIEHAAMACASDELSNVSWPAPEFKSKLVHTGTLLQSEWNTELHLCNLYELVSRLRLPYFRYSDLEAEDWPAACRDVWNYVATVTKKDSGSAKICLHRQIAEVMVQTKKNFDQLCWLASEDGPCEPSYVNMAWVDLIDACIHYKLISLRSGHLDIRKPDEDDDEGNAQKVEDFVETLVYYYEKDLDDWEPPGNWLDAMRDTETAEHGQLKPAVKVAATKRDKSLLEESAREQMPLDESTSANGHDVSLPHMSNVLSDAKEWTNLRQRVQQERAAADSFQARLEASLSVPASPAGPFQPSLHGFHKQFSPILARSSYRGQPDRNQRWEKTRPAAGQQLSASLTLPTDATNPSPDQLMATPRRPLHTRRRSQMVHSYGHIGSDAASFADGSKDLINIGGGDGGRQSLTTALEHDLHAERDQASWADLSLSERVDSMRERVNSQKEEDLLYEMKLRRMMEASPLL